MSSSTGRRAGGGVIAGLALLLTGCAAGPSGGSGGGTETSGAASADPAVAQHVDSTASGWIAGNKITLTGADYDADSSKITVSAKVENLANTDSLDGHQTESIFLDTGDGAPLALATTSSVAVQSSTTKVDFEFDAPAAGVDLADAVLQLGAADERQWLLPLASDGKATGLDPVRLDVTGIADANGMALNVDHVDIVPWSCDSVSASATTEDSTVYYDTIKKDELGIIIWGDVTEAQSIVGGDTLKQATLLTPDGTSTNYIGSFSRVFDINERTRDFPACFTVDSPVKGDYVLTWESYRDAVATFTFTVSDAVG